MIRRLIVRTVAWAMRRGVTEDQVRDAMIRCFPHRDINWRTEMIEAAEQRNRDRVMRKINA